MNAFNQTGLALVVSLLSSVAAQAEENASSLFNAHFCFACHSVGHNEVKKLGPYITDVADKYRIRADAPKFLVKKVLEGSQGVWGDPKTSIMPPNKVTSDEAAQLVQWILLQK